MAGVKYCSTSLMESWLKNISSGWKGAAPGNIICAICTSCSSTPTILSCTSDALEYFLAETTEGGFPEFTIGASGINQYMTILPCSCDLVINSGVASYVAIFDDSSTVRYLTTVTTQDLVAGNKVNVGEWTITINQPTP